MLRPKRLLKPNATTAVSKIGLSRSNEPVISIITCSFMRRERRLKKYSHEWRAFLFLITKLVNCTQINKKDNQGFHEKDRIET